MATTIDLRQDLSDRFHASMIWLLDEDFEFGQTLTANQERAIKIFETLLNTVDAIPQPLLDSAIEHQTIDPELFARITTELAQHVGHGFVPADATAYVEEMIKTFRMNARSR